MLVWKWKTALVVQSCPTLWDTMGCSPLGSSDHRILQARILEWIAIPFSRRSSWPRDRTQVSCIIGRFFTIWTTWEFQYMYILCANLLQWCPTLCSPVDCSLPGSSVHGIFQAWILEWVVISFFKGSSQPRDQTRVSFIDRWILYHQPHLGSPVKLLKELTLKPQGQTA